MCRQCTAGAHVILFCSSGVHCYLTCMQVLLTLARFLRLQARRLLQLRVLLLQLLLETASLLQLAQVCWPLHSTVQSL